MPGFMCGNIGNNAHGQLATEAVSISLLFPKTAWTLLASLISLRQCLLDAFILGTK